MKNKLPFVFLAGGAIIVIVAFLMMRGRGGGSLEEVDNIPELPFSQRPYVELTPSEDGHYLNIVVDNINVPGAASMEYELYYSTSEGINQGVNGISRFSGDFQDRYENELLLGSESSGKYRYDEGIEGGTLTVKFRGSDGKSIGKVAGQWAFMSSTDTLSSLDGKFTYTLEDSSDAYFVVMPVFGVPESAPGEISSGPYGVFASEEGPFAGDVNLVGDVYGWYGGGWESITGASDNIGVFISTN